MANFTRDEYTIASRLFSNAFGRKLKELRNEKGLTQKDIAEAVGVAISTYANWEQGRREPSIFDIYGLMEAFQVDANELFDQRADISDLAEIDFSSQFKPKEDNKESEIDQLKLIMQALQQFIDNNNGNQN